MNIKEDPKNDLDNETMIENKAKAQVLFKSRQSVDSEGTSCTTDTKRPSKGDKLNTLVLQDIVLKGDPVSIVCQNIYYYMGGTRDIWKKSGGQLGLEFYDRQNNEDVLRQQMDSVLTAEQRYNDGKLEFFTYSSGLKIGFEKIATGQADKIHQGSGPFILKFKPTPDKVYNWDYCLV
jgi:hypothetical protein